MPSMCRIDTHLRQFPNLSLKDSLIFTGTSRTINALENILKLHTTPPHQLPELFGKSDWRTEIIHKSKKEQISEILGMASNNLWLEQGDFNSYNKQFKEKKIKNNNVILKEKTNNWYELDINPIIQFLEQNSNYFKDISTEKNEDKVEYNFRTSVQNYTKQELWDIIENLSQMFFDQSLCLSQYSNEGYEGFKITIRRNQLRSNPNSSIPSDINNRIDHYFIKLDKFIEEFNSK